MTNDICPLNMIPLKLSETKSVKFERASQTSIFYKYLYTEEFKEATVVKKKKRTLRKVSSNFSQPSNPRPGISEEKKIF